MKYKFKVNLNNVADIKNFVNYTSMISSDVIVKSQDGKYIVNGKSLLGIMSLDLSKDIIVETDCENMKLYLKQVGEN